MAKAKFDFKSIEIPEIAQKPVYAGVGAGDLAIAAVREYVVDVQKKITGYSKDVETRVADVQKQVNDFDPKTLADTAVTAAKERRAAAEKAFAELQKDAVAFPGKVQTRVQTVVNDNVATVSKSYADLAKHGEAVIKGTKLPSSASVEVKVNTTNPAATKGAEKPAAKKSPAKRSAAKKATTAKKAPAKKAPAKKASTSSTAAKKA
ncbi:MAG: hypothetical protein CMH83_18715 [Nocardioides sp.]|nr:hypothetical protein [Nocardioides sp.]